VKYQVKDAAKRELKERKGRQKYEYQCAHCQQWWSAKDVEVDHVIPAGSLKEYDDLPGFVERMFCEQDGLQVLCRECHKQKTEDDK
jgi:5-methylcytosine-specific restriction endonuclease McrA